LAIDMFYETSVGSKYSYFGSEHSRWITFSYIYYFAHWMP